MLPSSDQTFISHSFYLSTINFCFYDRDGIQFAIDDETYGSAAATACFQRCFGEWPIHPDDILSIASSSQKTQEFFRGKNPIPLLEPRRNNLKETAEVLAEKFDGNPLNIILAGCYDAEKILETLCQEFPSAFGLDKVLFETSKGRWLSLQFHKRARLWLLIYQGRALNSCGGLAPLKNSEKIGAIADYRVPCALRELEILEYSAKLEQGINSGFELTHGSKPEIEIRLATMYAVEKLLIKINSIRTRKGTSALSMAALDFFLWNTGKQSSLKPHFTITTAY